MQQEQTAKDRILDATNAVGDKVTDLKTFTRIIRDLGFFYASYDDLTERLKRQEAFYNVYMMAERILSVSEETEDCINALFREIAKSKVRS